MKMKSMIAMILTLSILLVIGCDRDEEINESITAPAAGPIWSAVAQDGRLTVRSSLQEQAVYVFISAGETVVLPEDEWGFGAPSANANQEQVVLRVGRGKAATSFDGKVDRFIEVDLDHNDEFGHSVIVSEDHMIVVIGAPGANGGAGALYIMEIEGRGVGELLMADHQVHRVGADDLKYLFPVSIEAGAFDVEVAAIPRVGSEIRLETVEQRWFKEEVLVVGNGEHRLSRPLSEILAFGLQEMRRVKSLTEERLAGDGELGVPHLPPVPADAFPHGEEVDVPQEEDNREDVINVLLLVVDAMEDEVSLTEDRIGDLEDRLHDLDDAGQEGIDPFFWLIDRMDDDIHDLWDEVDDLFDAVHDLRRDAGKVDRLIEDVQGALKDLDNLNDQVRDLERHVRNLEDELADEVIVVE